MKHEHASDYNNVVAPKHLQEHLLTFHDAHATEDLIKIHTDLHAGYDTDPEATAIAEVRRILDTELWVMEHWDKIPKEHRLIILHALAMEESKRLAEWRFER